MSTSRRIDRQSSNAESLLPGLVKPVVVFVRVFVKIASAMVTRHEIWCFGSHAIPSSTAHSSGFWTADMTQLTGCDVRRLMRAHGKTIRSLAEAMNVTQKRVRDVRARGVAGVAYVADWLEALQA
jgi:hypothetical protein